MAYEPRRPRSNGNGNGTSGGGGGGYAPYGGWSGAQSASEQLRDILHVFFKRKRFIALLFLTVALPGLFVTALRKPSYVASAKVMISTQRSEPTLQPTDLTKLETIQLNESLVNSEVHVIGRRGLLEGGVRVLATSGDGNGPPHVEPKSTPFGQQVLAMAQNLSITPIKASNVIQIDYKSAEPEIAARVINR